MQNKIVLVPFPFDDLSSMKVRPALCLTDPIGTHDHIVLAFLTSQIPSTPLTSDVVIDSTHPDFALTGLRVSSTLQLHRLVTLTKSLLARQLGEISPAMQIDVQQRLRQLFRL